MADIRTALVNCDFIRITTHDENDGKDLYYEGFPSFLENLNLEDSEEKIQGDKVKIYKKAFDKGKKLWEIQLLRFRDKVLPGIEDGSTGEYEVIKVGEGDKLAEFNTLIFDPQTYCILMHRNRNGLSVKSLEIYLNSLIKFQSESKKIRLNPILKNFDKNKYIGNQNVVFKRLDFSIDMNDIENNGIFGKILQIGNIKGKRIKCGISMGRSAKDEGLDKEIMEDIINSDIVGDKWKSLRVGLLENINSEVETFDLIHNRMCTALELDYTAESPIEHKTIYKIFSVDYNKNYRNEKPVRV